MAHKQHIVSIEGVEDLHFKIRQPTIADFSSLLKVVLSASGKTPDELSASLGGMFDTMLKQQQAGDERPWSEQVDIKEVFGVLVGSFIRLVTDDETKRMTFAFMSDTATRRSEANGNFDKVDVGEWEQMPLTHVVTVFKEVISHPDYLSFFGDISASLPNNSEPLIDSTENTVTPISTSSPTETSSSGGTRGAKKKPKSVH